MVPRIFGIGGALGVSRRGLSVTFTGRWLLFPPLRFIEACFDLPAGGRSGPRAWVTGLWPQRKEPGDGPEPPAMPVALTGRPGTAHRCCPACSCASSCDRAGVAEPPRPGRTLPLEQDPNPDRIRYGPLRLSDTPAQGFRILLVASLHVLSYLYPHI